MKKRFKDVIPAVITVAVVAIIAINTRIEKTTFTARVLEVYETIKTSEYTSLPETCYATKVVFEDESTGIMLNKKLHDYCLEYIGEDLNIHYYEVRIFGQKKKEFDVYKIVPTWLNKVEIELYKIYK